MKKNQKQHHGLHPHVTGILTLLTAALVINYMMIHAPYANRNTSLNIKAAGTGHVQQDSMVSDALEDMVKNTCEKRTMSQDCKSEALALFKTDQLYLIDHDAHVLAPADSAGFIDLPILSGEALKIDWNTLKVTGSCVEDALTTLRYMKRISALYTQCSEIIVDQEGGVVVYMDWDQVLPVILGRKDLKYKVDKMAVLTKHIQYVPEIRNARYLDLRIKGHAVIKQNT